MSISVLLNVEMVGGSLFRNDHYATEKFHRPRRSRYTAVHVEQRMVNANIELVKVRMFMMLSG